FSLGVCLYEALTGENLYERASEYETVAAIVLGEEAPRVRSRRPDVPEALDAIVAATLAKDRSARTPSADALAEALLELAATARLRHAHFAEALRRLVPDLVDRPPQLDRR